MEAQYETIEGRRVEVVTDIPPLPQKLDALLSAMFSVSLRHDISPSGTRPECSTLRSHPFVAIRQGRFLGPDRVLRDLLVEMCPHCGAVCVRDISVDRMAGLPVGRGGPRRHDLILGWYSGARRNQRVYR